MVQPFSILQTKLYLPPLRPSLVGRPELLHRLNRPQEGQVTVLSAPAGFGKTSLIAEWAGQKDETFPCGRPIAWLSLDEGDNDLVRFWRYVVAALQTVQPAIGQAAEPLLAAVKGSGRDCEPLLTLLINDMTATTRPGEQLWLVLDDYHLIHAGPIHESLHFLLQHQPPLLHLLILSRTDPPLSLARLRVEGRLLELRAADLRFSLAETEQFLNQVMGLGLPAEAIITLANRTEGWAAALQLAALSLKGMSQAEAASFVGGFAGYDQHLFSYLVEEVLQRQPPAIEQFLLRTAVLRRLTAPLCQVVTGQTDSAAILAQLARQNLFVTPLDRTGEWYRYHPLFAELLQARLGQLEPALLPELHRRASGWCAQNGFGVRAIHHALAAEDFPTAARLIEQQAERTWSQGNLATVLGWLEALPADLISNEPHLCLVYTWILFLHDRCDEANHYWRTAEPLIAALAPPEQSQLRGRWAAIGGAMAAHRHDAGLTLHLTEESLQSVPADDTTWREVTMINRGLAYLWQGKANQASAAFQEAVEVCQRQGNSYLLFAALWHQAEASLAAGCLHQAAAIYQQLQQLDDSEAGRQLFLKANGAVGLAGLAYERNDLVTAEALLTESLPKLWPGGQPRVVLYGRLVLARCYQAKGDSDAAHEQLGLAEAMVRQLKMTAESRLVAVVRANLAFNQHDDGSVQHWLQSSGVSPDDPADFRREMEHLLLLRLLLRQRRYQETRALLQRLATAAEQDGRQGSLIELHLLQALLCQAQGQQEQAGRPLAQALALAQREGYVRTFVDGGRAVASLLHEAARQGIWPAYTGQLLPAFGRRLDPANALLAGPVLEPLTGREQEILALVACGFSNQQIAARLVLSVGTVKGHLNHIFEKFDVQNRTEAVMRGRLLGLVE